MWFFWLSFSLRVRLIISFSLLIILCHYAFKASECVWSLCLTHYNAFITGYLKEFFKKKIIRYYSPYSNVFMDLFQSFCFGQISIFVMETFLSPLLNLVHLGFSLLFSPLWYIHFLSFLLFFHHHAIFASSMEETMN